MIIPIGTIDGQRRWSRRGHGDKGGVTRSALVGRWAPGLADLWGYRRGWLRGDLMAGVTVAAYLVPQVLAYATIAGLPPITGLWAVLPALATYALLGTSRLLSVGPESTTALMTAAVVGPLAGGDPARYAGMAGALAVIVGLLCLLSRMARLGFVADLLSRPILVGYLAGVALIMMVGQLGKLTGAPVHGDTFFGQLVSFLTNVSAVQAATAVFGPWCWYSSSRCNAGCPPRRLRCWRCCSPPGRWRCPT
jgi:SulP family sulfate permease